MRVFVEHVIVVARCWGRNAKVYLASFNDKKHGLLICSRVRIPLNPPVQRPQTCSAGLEAASGPAPRCTGTTGVPDVALMPSWASTSRCAGERCVRHSCVNTRCVWRARGRIWWWLPRLPTTSGRSRTAASALTGSICKACASHVTTERRRVRGQSGARRGLSMQTNAKC